MFVRDRKGLHDRSFKVDISIISPWSGSGRKEKERDKKRLRRSVCVCER